MPGALVSLTFWSVRNRLRARLRRLREPRYLAGSIVGVALVLRLRAPQPVPGAAPGTAAHRVAVRGSDQPRRVGSVRGRARSLRPGPADRARARAGAAPLEFSPAEVQFLFPAPITRRQLLHYKVLRSQGGLLFGTAIATLFLRPATLRSGWMFLVGFWIALTACRLYSIGVGLDRGRPTRRPAGPLGAQRGLAALWLAALVVLGAAAAADGHRLGALATAHDVLEELRRIWSAGAPRIVLWPFVTLAGLPLSPSSAAFASGLPGALLIVFLAYAWVMRAGTALGGRRRRPGRGSRGVAARGAAGEAERVAAAVQARARGETGDRDPLEEPDPRRALRLAVDAVAAPPFVPLLALAARGGRGGAFALSVCLMSAFMLPLFGPIVARNDLRQDLTRLALLKSWPVSGASIVRGELLAPALLLSVLEWLLIAACAILVRAVPLRAGTKTAVLFAHLGSHVATAMLLAPALILAQLVVQNGIAVLFPAWMILGKSRVRGVEGMGQQMLMTWGGLLLSCAFLAPPAAGAAVVMLAFHAMTHTIVVVAPAAVLFALLVAESLLVTGWLGRVLDRADLAAVDPVE